jgi:hypothetical protein
MSAEQSRRRGPSVVRYREVMRAPQHVAHLDGPLRLPEAGLRRYFRAWGDPMRRPELLRIALAVGITLAVVGLAAMFFMLVFDQDPADWFHHLLNGERIKPRR